MSVISFDSSGMEMEPQAKRGDMIQTTKSSEESGRNKEPLVRSKNRTLVANELICQSAKVKCRDAKRHQKIPRQNR